MATAREFVDWIRRTQYLMDVTLPPEHAEGARNIRDTLNRTLKLLSEDLYSKHTHFALELVQNADDNSYPEERVPEIAFTIDPGRLDIDNNESGFSPENVRALCDAGKSTKSRHEGYIGEKGIGFKSVFAVSQRPEIHSNGFHFRFDVSEDNPLGYVVPEWIDGCTDRPGTRIVLPAKSGQNFSAAVFAEITPTLLLFLRKLRRLRLVDNQGATEQIAERQDDRPYVTLAQTKSVRGKAAGKQASRYLLVRHEFSTTSVTDDKRPKSVHTQVDLAFKIDTRGAAIASETQPVFAFLPIRDFGFTFLVQGDFLLSSSREDIHRERPWNILIRDHIATAFIAALPRFRESASLARSFLAYVPDPDTMTDGFFRVAAQEISDRLKDCECVLGGSGTWRKPNQILFADRTFRELFTPDIVWTDLGLEYASDDLSPPLKSVALRLGATEARFGHLLRLAGSDRLGEHSAEWFTRFYRYLGPLLQADARAQQTRALALIRLHGGKLTTVAQGPVFFPLTRKRQYGFEGELSLVDEEVLTGSDSEVQEIQECLRTLGVKEASPASLIRNHLLPRHANADWKESNFTALTGHVRYIKDHLDAFLSGAAAAGQTRDQALEQLRTGLRIRTLKEADGSVYFGRPRTLYLSDAYSPEVRLQAMLEDGTDPIKFVSTLYVSEATRSATSAAPSDEAVAQWRAFFYAIGVNRIPTVSATDSFGSDYVAGPELVKLLNTPDTVRAGITLVDRNWSSYYHDYATCRIYPRLSTFSSMLREVLAPTVRGKSARLCETYLDTEHIRAVFGRSVPYLDVSISDTQFMEASGITHHVDMTACFKRLDQLRAAQRVSTQEVRSVYRALENFGRRMEATIRAGFTDEPRIFVPSNRSWHTTETVVWDLHGELLDELYPPLRNPYAEHRTFFCETLSVALHPSEDSLISALESIPQRIANAERRQHEAHHIYRRLSVALYEHAQVDSSEEHPQWLQRLKAEQLFLDHVGRLVGADEDLFINDDPGLADAFRSHVQISFLELDRSRLSTIEPLLRACAIPRLSVAVRYELHAVSQPLPNEDLSQRIQARHEAVMRLVFHRAHRIFEQAKEDGRWGALSRLIVAQVTTLSVTATLLSYSVTLPSDIFQHEGTIYVQLGARSARDKICLVLCTFLGLRNDWADSIYRILFAATDEEIEDFLQIRGAEAIPPDELELPPALPSAQFERNVNTEESVDSVSSESWSEMDVPPPTSTHRTQRPSTEAHPSLESAVLGRHDTGRLAGASEGKIDSVEIHRASVRLNTSSTLPPRAREPSGRLLSYAEPHLAEAATGAGSATDESAERRRISDAAVAFVLERERAEGHQVREMDFANEGFDILRTVPGEADEYIEVKGVTGRWTEIGIALTPPELRHAERYRSLYFLFVVEFATDPARRTLYRIRDPFGKTQQFRFDSGWKGVSTTLDIAEPAVGMRIDLPSGSALIQSVERRGLFFSLTVETAAGTQLTTLYVPGKMRLHRE